MWFTTSSLNYVCIVTHCLDDWMWMDTGNSSALLAVEIRICTMSMSCRLFQHSFSSRFQLLHLIAIFHNNRQQEVENIHIHHSPTYVFLSDKKASRMCEVEVFNYWCGCKYNIVIKKCHQAVLLGSSCCTELVVKRHLQSAVKCGAHGGSYLHRVAFGNSGGIWNGIFKWWLNQDMRLLPLKEVTWSDWIWYHDCPYFVKWEGFSGG